jgi:hypothetical protein
MGQNLSDLKSIIVFTPSRWFHNCPSGLGLASSPPIQIARAERRSSPPSAAQCSVSRDLTHGLLVAFTSPNPLFLPLRRRRVRSLDLMGTGTRNANTFTLANDALHKLRRSARQVLAIAENRHWLKDGTHAIVSHHSPYLQDIMKIPAVSPPEPPRAHRTPVEVRTGVHH